MPLSKSAKYYRSHPISRAKKQKYDAVLNRRPSQVNKREDLNQYNYQHKARKGDGMDASHKGNKIVGYSKASRNRGDKNNSIGDRHARSPKFGPRKS